MTKRIAALLGATARSYYNWKKEKRPIISLLETYFTKEDIDEFLEHGKITRYEPLRATNTHIKSLPFGKGEEPEIGLLKAIGIDPDVYLHRKNQLRELIRKEKGSFDEFDERLLIDVAHRAAEKTEEEYMVWLEHRFGKRASNGGEK